MGIYESVQRSRGAIDELAGMVQGHYARKREKKRRQDILEMLRTQEETQGPSASIRLNAGSFGSGAPSQRREGRSVSGAEIPVVTPQQALRQQLTEGGAEKVELPTVGPLRERMRSPDELSFEDLNKLGGLLHPEDANRGLEFALSSERAKAPAYDILNQEGGGYTMFERRRGQKPKVVGEKVPAFRASETNRYFHKPRVENGNPVTVRFGNTIRTVWDEYDRNTGQPTGGFEYKEGGSVSDKGGTGGGDLTDIEKRIAALGAKNQERGQQMVMLDNGLYKDAQGNVLETGSPGAQSLKANLTKQIQDDEAEIKRLSKRIGSDFTGEGWRSAEKVKVKVRLTRDVDGLKKGQLAEIDNNEFDPAVMEKVKE